MNNERNCVILTQYRNGSEYNDFIGKYYHFPANNNKNYINYFEKVPVEFIYYEPEKNGEGVFFGYGTITKKPFIDKRDNDYCFVEINNYQPFDKPVYFKNDDGIIIERIFNDKYYNANNAVRKIEQNLLDDLCLNGGIILTIESDAHLIKVLGEQLIGSEKVGVLELIKNSVDANATYCRVRIENIPNLRKLDDTEYELPEYRGPVIIIEDDGVGMSRQIIENGWLRPASPIKTNIKEQLKKERNNALKTGSLGSYDALLTQLKNEHGRIPLGEKGVGRFATHRLGRFLEVRTKTKEIPYELVLKIDWDLFDKHTEVFTNLNSIGISLYKSEFTRDYGERNSGTRLIIYGGREGFQWDEKVIEELNRSILNLNSPINDRIGNGQLSYPIFSVIFDCPQIENLTKRKIYEEVQPNFTLDAIINKNGIIDSYEMKFQHPEEKIPTEQWSGENIDLRYPESTNYWYMENIKREPECGEFYINLKVFYRTKEWIGITEYKDVIQYLDEYGGLTIYRDGILMLDSKISSEFDWLGLGKKHIKQGFRISYRDFLGTIEINQDKNINLIDKTNREGFIENKAAHDLSVLVTEIIEKIIFPKYREKRDQLAKMLNGLVSDPKQLSYLAKTSSTFFSNVSNSDYPLETDPYNFFANLWQKTNEKRMGVINLSNSMKELQKSIKMIEDVQDLFVEQAGFGIAVAVSLHEINKITSNFYHGISSLIKAGDFDKITLEDLRNTSASLQSELKRLSPLRSLRNEKSIRFNIMDSIKYAYEVFRRRLRIENIQFEIRKPEEDFSIFGKYSAINQVFGNLIDNSSYWIKYSGKQVKRILVILNKQYRTVIFADSGSNINEIIRPNLFQPGYSLKEPPSGLGLYICKTYLENLKARIYETPYKDRFQELSGAQFTLDFFQTPEGEQL